MLDLKQLQYLNAIYHYKNFTRASEVLYVSQPAISASIKRLEEELGIKLLVRTSKNVSFTEEGEQFMKWVTKLLNLCDETENVIKDLSTTSKQRLRFGISPCMCDPTIPLIFSDFLEENPLAEIYMDEGSMNKHLKMLESNVLDLTFNGIPEDYDDSFYDIIPVSQAEIHAVMQPGHPLTSIERIPLSLLASERLIMMDTQSRVQGIMLQEFDRKKLTPNIVTNYDQIACMVNIVQMCNYVGIISVARNMSALACDGLVIRPFEEPITFDIGFILRKDKYSTKLEHKLIEFVKDIYS